MATISSLLFSFSFSLSFVSCFSHLILFLIFFKVLAMLAILLIYLFQNPNPFSHPYHDFLSSLPHGFRKWVWGDVDFESMVVVGGLVWTPVRVMGDGVVSMCVGLIVFVFLRYWIRILNSLYPLHKHKKNIQIWLRFMVSSKTQYPKLSYTNVYTLTDPFKNATRSTTLMHNWRRPKSGLLSFLVLFVGEWFVVYGRYWWCSCREEKER